MVNHVKAQNPAARGRIQHVYCSLDSHAAVLGKCNQTHGGPEVDVCQGPGSQGITVLGTNRDVNGGYASHSISSTFSTSA